MKMLKATCSDNGEIFNLINIEETPFNKDLYKTTNIKENDSDRYEYYCLSINEIKNYLLEIIGLDKEIVNSQNFEIK